MALEKRVTAIPLGSVGMDSSKNPHISPGNIQVINANYDIEGIISKREGSEVIANLKDNSINLATFKNNVVSWGSEANIHTDSQNLIDSSLGILDIERTNIPNSIKNVAFQCDYAELDDIYVISYNTITKTPTTDSYGLYIETFNKLDQQIDILELQAETGTEKRFARLVKMTDQNKVMAYWMPIDGYMERVSIDSYGDIGSSADISGMSVGKTSGQSFDACYLENNGVDGYVIIAYPRTEGRTGVVSLNDGITVVHQDTQTTLSTYNTLAASVWRQTKDSFFVANIVYRNGSITEVKMTPYNLTFDAGYTTTYGISYSNSTFRVMGVTGVAMTDTSARVYYTLLRVPGSILTDWVPEVHWAELHWNTGSLTYIHSDVDIWQPLAQIAMKPIRWADNNHILGTYVKSWGTELTAQDQLTFLNKDGNIVGRSLIGIARSDEYGVNTQWDSYAFIPQICETSDGYHGASIFPWIRRLSVDDTQQSDKFQLAKLNFECGTVGNSFAETPKTLIMANSMPYEYNGKSIIEAGFPIYPEKIYGEGAAGIGGMVGAGAVYKYVALFEETDENGVIHRSAPTPTPLSITMGGSDNGVNLFVPLFPGRRNNSYTVVYRTTADGVNEYWRVFSIKHEYPYLNYVQVSDGLNDSKLTDNEQLYTDSRELENGCSRPHRISCIWQNRYVYADRDNESSRIYYSKLFNPDFATSFNDALYFNINNDGDNITALFPFSNKLIIFKKQRIYATSGNGFDNIGGGSNFSEPWMVSPSLGCIDSRSLVRTPEGVIFQSDRGLWMLTQNEQLSPIGEPIKKYSYGDWNVIGTGSVHNRHEVQLIVDDGYSVSYNWMNNKWSAISDRDGYSAISANNKVYWVDRDNNLNSTVQGEYNDNGSFYPLRVDTGWISFAGLGGFQRVWKFLIVGYNLGGHKLKVKVAYNLDPCWTDVSTYEPTTTSFSLDKYYDAGLGLSGEDQAYTIECTVSRQKSTSIRISIEDESDGVASQGMAITGIVFEYGVMSTLKPTGSARTNTSED